MAMSEVHPFDQVPGAWVRVCWCGKWPDHHVHGGGRVGCWCEFCNPVRRFVVEVDPDAMAEVIAAIGPPGEVLDVGLPTATFTVEGVYEYGQTPTGEAEPG